jgi:hypothetical protein
MNTVKCSNHLCGKEYNVQFDKCPFCGTDNPMKAEERKVLIDKELDTAFEQSGNSADG